jgi:hypothetical protein
MHGDAKRSFAEVMDEWVPAVSAECGPKTVQRCLCSLEQWPLLLANCSRT